MNVLFELLLDSLNFSQVFIYLRESAVIAYIGGKVDRGEIIQGPGKGTVPSSEA